MPQKIIGNVAPNKKRQIKRKKVLDPSPYPSIKLYKINPVMKETRIIAMQMNDTNIFFIVNYLERHCMRLR
jgi:hypothetical protein